MNKNYKDYLNKNHNFDKLMLVGIFALVIVISGIFGFLYGFIFLLF